MIETERPLVTFALFAYNQEKYIREAVEGALAQDYSPLQIILSDDFSADRTFEIMQEAVADYDGPHRIVLNGNPSNLGVGEHVNRVVEMAEGVLVVGAAGDDISMPDRVTETVKAWERTGRRATSIWSSIELINEFGHSLGIDPAYHQEDRRSLIEFADHTIVPHGCSHAFSRPLMLRFGRMNSNVVTEDQVIGFRSALAGALTYINKPLVQYRIHGSSLFSKQRLSRSLDAEQTRTMACSFASMTFAFRRQNIDDARTVLDGNDKVIAILEREVVTSEFSAALFGRKLGFWSALIHAAKAVRRGAEMSVIGKLLVKVAIWPIYAPYREKQRRLLMDREQKRC